MDHKALSGWAGSHSTNSIGSISPAPIKSKIIGVAELVGVVRNDPGRCGYWQVPGQWSLVLSRVWEVEPVPCTGGRGVFHFGRCVRCNRPIALDYGDACKRCAPGLVYPEQLTIKAVYGPDGEAL